MVVCQLDLLLGYDNEVEFLEEKGICSLVILSGNQWTRESSKTVTLCNYELNTE
jgi:hypothetical protein